MDFLGDLAFLIGTIGIVIYMCLIIIRFTTQSGKVKAGIKKYEDQIVRLKEKIAELKEQRDASNPEVDELVNKVIGLREQRDKLFFRYEEMVDKSRERDINIKYKTH